MPGEVTVGSTDPSTRGGIWGLIPSLGLFTLAMQEEVSLGLCLHGSGARRESCSWPNTVSGSLCREKSPDGRNNPGRVNGGVAGAVKAVAHPPIPSHAPCTWDDFLLLRGFLPLTNHLQATAEPGKAPGGL